MCSMLQISAQLFIYGMTEAAWHIAQSGSNEVALLARVPKHSHKRRFSLDSMPSADRWASAYAIAASCVQQRTVLQLFRMQGLMLNCMQGHPLLDTKGRARTSCQGALRTGKPFCQAHVLSSIVMLLCRHRHSPR